MRIFDSALARWPPAEPGSQVILPRRAKGRGEHAPDLSDNGGLAHPVRTQDHDYHTRRLEDSPQASLCVPCPVRDDRSQS